MVEYAYPGVYVAEVETGPRPIPGVPTSVSAFMSREAIAAIGGLLDRLPPDWTDDMQHDPGFALLELAAWLGEQVLYRSGRPPDAAVHAAARLAVASLSAVSDRRVQDSPIDRTRYYPGVLLDQGTPVTDTDGATCLKIVRKDRVDPLAACRFRLSLAGVAVAAFGEVDGLSTGRPQGFFDTLLERLRKLLGLRKLSRITLKRGMAADRSLADWYRNRLAGRSDRRDVVIRQSEPRAEFRLVNAWVTKFEGPALNGSANDVAIETLELACEALCLRPPA